jgi:hypothetical protein
MNFRKNSTLIIGLGVAVILLGIAIFFLVGNRSDYNDAKSALVSAKARLNALNNRDPFPSDENIRETEEQLTLIRTNYATIINSMRAGQLLAEPIEPARFAVLLEDASRRLRERAQADGVTLPTEPGLGFKDYAAGKLPPNNPAVMERLVIQIKAIEHLANLLMNAKVSSIDVFQRDQFEYATEVSAVPETVQPLRGRGAVAAVAGRQATTETRMGLGGIPIAKPSDLYTTERFVIEFSGRESAVWDVLNRLASSKTSYVVADVRLTSTATDLGKPVDLKARLQNVASASRGPMGGPIGSPSAQPTPSMDSLSREERVVGGRELIKVRLVVDMYRFNDAPVVEESAQ